MCGIVAVVRRRSRRAGPALGPLAGALADAERDLAAAADAGAALDADHLAAVAGALLAVDAELRGVPGLLALLGDGVGFTRVEHAAAAVEARLPALEAAVEAVAGSEAGADVEALNAQLVRVKDAAWAIVHDRLRGARAVDELRGAASSPAAVEAYASIQVALSALDRLEVRGRDSAGLHVLVADHDLDLDDPAIARLAAPRVGDALFGSMAVRTAGGALGFVYKRAAEVGELGDNVRALREAIRHDELLRLAVDSPASRATVLAHTRWASVGIISEPNAHPLNQEPASGEASDPYVVAALNGDVDNYADLAALETLDVPREITTDAKVIPMLVARRAAALGDPLAAFRATVSTLEGSVAIAAQVAAGDSPLLLAQRGSGQALYVGLAEDAFVVASEPYGLVEECGAYLRLDGETPRVSGNAASAGQIVALDAARAGDVSGVRRLAYDGAELPVGTSDLVTPEITTRDIERAGYPHFLLKEISEAPASFRKTLRGRIVEHDGRLAVRLGDDTLPTDLRHRLRAGDIRVIHVIGQGTAAVAGRSLALALRRELAGSGIVVEALAATELSGFGMRDDMTDTLVIAISQSGTTTDTNRTVDVVRARGGAVVSIVNRRQSDLVDKSDGVLYTSDGRDVEMSVASTKAFYAQIAAGLLLAFAIAAETGHGTGRDRHDLLAGLRSLPDAMAAVVAGREPISAAAHRHAPPRRSWAIVGNGANRIAAEEVRIKLSELCYKAIACDVTEDKKHIDLSSEPLVLVCAAGLDGSNADDVAKEVAIYRAHKAAPIVIATEGDHRYDAADEVIAVPRVHRDLAFVLSAMAGHLFGYEAALAIDATARPLREARAAIEAVAAGAVAVSGDEADVLDDLSRELLGPAARFFEGLRVGAYNGTLDAATAVRVASLVRYATRMLPLDTYELEFGKAGTPSALVDDLLAALTIAIEELTRPVDAIRHQAKTVTVGISRSDETLLRGRLVQEVVAAGVARDHLGYRALRALAALDPAVESVVGFTRYRVEGEVGRDATLQVVDRGGVATGIRSRTDGDPRLRGTKRRAATEREVTVARGRADGRTVVIVPEVKANHPTGITLLHVRFHEHLPAEIAEQVLRGYRGRYDALHDAVTETEPSFRGELLGEVPIVDLLTEPVLVLADRWRAGTGA
jgi:glucosamine--fructose-6-phosphate aminotransferase (isomerizing)